MAKLSKENFAYFEQEARRWLKYFGIYQWDCRFFFEKDENALARVTWEPPNGIAAFYLARTWGKDRLDSKFLSKVAFHEVCELLLWELNEAVYTSYRDTAAEATLHRVIRTLENTVFENEWERSQVS